MADTASVLLFSAPVEVIWDWVGVRAASSVGLPG